MIDLKLTKGVTVGTLFTPSVSLQSVMEDKELRSQVPSTSTSTSTGIVTPNRRREYDKHTQKVCIKCKEVRDKADYGKHKDTPDGLQSYCKFCKGELGKRRRDKNVKARLRHHIATRVAAQLGKYCPKDITAELEKYLGYKLGDLVKYLGEELRGRHPELKLRQVLNDGWHVDHIYPLSRFPVLRAGGNKGDSDVDWEEFRRCWAIENLKAIPAKENLAKGAKVLPELRQGAPF